MIIFVDSKMYFLFNGDWVNEFNGYFDMIFRYNYFYSIVVVSGVVFDGIGYVSGLYIELRVVVGKERSVVVIFFFFEYVNFFFKFGVGSDGIGFS